MAVNYIRFKQFSLLWDHYAFIDVPAYLADQLFIKHRVGANVFHKDYGSGTIAKITDAKIYIDFAGRLRVFSYPEAFEKEYLILI